MNRRAISFAFTAALLCANGAWAADIDVRGMWEVTVTVATAGNQTHRTTWLIGTDGDNLFGASQWTCCPGFRVDRLAGVIEGNRVEIMRLHVKQGSASGTQSYVGTVSGNSASGTWSGLGGNGNWTAQIRR